LKWISFSLQSKEKEKTTMMKDKIAIWIFIDTFNDNTQWSDEKSREKKHKKAIMPNGYDG
jgi:hypothetical protein